jgi:hypothetical protein
MIDVLRRAPSIVRLEYRQRSGAKYAARKGLWWDVAPPLEGALHDLDTGIQTQAVTAEALADDNGLSLRRKLKIG